jgi:hypothetical protein
MEAAIWGWLAVILLSAPPVEAEAEALLVASVVL